MALFEELVRVFLLRRLWLVWPAPAARWVAILFVSLFVGLVHLYQGPAAMLSIGLQSVILGAFYLRTRRVRAMIVAHALYDSVQIVQVAIALG